MLENNSSLTPKALKKIKFLQEEDQKGGLSVTTADLLKRDVMGLEVGDDEYNEYLDYLVFLNPSWRETSRKIINKIIFGS